MKIAICHPEFLVRGGAERKALLLARELSRDHDVRVVCFEYDQNSTFSEYGDGLNIVVLSKNVGRIVQLFWMARQMLGSDMVIAHNHPSHFAALAVRCLTRVPVIWICNEPALYMPGLKLGFIKRTIRLFERWMVTCVNRVVSNSRFSQNWLKCAIRTDSTVVYSGLDLSLYETRDTVSERDPFRLIVVSRLVRHKQLDRLFGVLDGLKDRFGQLNLMIIGDGPDRDRLTRLSNGLPVAFRSGISEKEKVELMRSSAVFVFPTEHEPLGVTPIEAMAVGLPVVGYESGGVRETVVHGETGYLAKSDDEFKDYISTLLVDETLALRFGESGRKRAFSQFSAEAMVQSIRQIMQEIAV